MSNRASTHATGTHRLGFAVTLFDFLRAMFYSAFPIV